MQSLSKVAGSIEAHKSLKFLLGYSTVIINQISTKCDSNVRKQACLYLNASGLIFHICLTAGVKCATYMFLV